MTCVQPTCKDSWSRQQLLLHYTTTQSSSFSAVCRRLTFLRLAASLSAPWHVTVLISELLQFVGCDWFRRYVLILLRHLSYAGLLGHFSPAASFVLRAWADVLDYVHFDLFAEVHLWSGTYSELSCEAVFLCLHCHIGRCGCRHAWDGVLFRRGWMVYGVAQCVSRERSCNKSAFQTHNSSVVYRVPSGVSSRSVAPVDCFVCDVGNGTLLSPCSDAGILPRPSGRINLAPLLLL